LLRQSSAKAGDEMDGDKKTLSDNNDATKRTDFIPFSIRRETRGLLPGRRQGYRRLMDTVN
jgi:hypothetical protein